MLTGRPFFFIMVNSEMTVQQPFTSREVRWFFEGPLSLNSALRDWFFDCAPFGRGDGVTAPAWRPRRNDEPDIYLLLPGRENMGIKWREGLLQVKGLVAGVGERAFCERHAGSVERWIKWSYDSLPAEYAALFTATGVTTASVGKTRALRLVDLAPPSPVEVDPETIVKVGMGVELTQIVVEDREHCSLGFEAFPDERLTEAMFATAVEVFLESLVEIRLDAERSMSYAAWLNRL